MKKDVFIIGAGIAGLTAGVYALRYGMNVYLCDNGMV
jgi:thioredoxin reductase